MNYGLPTSVEIQGVEYAIRSDYRPILDICVGLSDPELNGQERAELALTIFYPDFKNMPPEHYEDAIKECLRFINGGEDEDQTQRNSPKLMDWEQDFSIVVSPINRVIGTEIRALDYLHWYTFLSAYYEIGGECTFAQVVSIRDKQARHKTLEKHEKEWLQRNRHLVEFKRKYTQAEDDLLKQWI